MILGVLIKLSYFELLPIFVVLMIGDLLGDVGWYYIGKYYGHRFVKRYGKYFSITENAISRVTDIFHKYKHRILIISKITNGFGFALVTCMTAGITRIPFWKYFGTNLLGQFIWTGILLGVGYFFGNLYIQVNTWLGYISVTALLIMIFALFFGYNRYLRNKATELISE